MKRFLVLACLIALAPGCGALGKLPLFSNGSSLPEDDNRVTVGGRATPGADGQSQGLSFQKVW